MGSNLNDIRYILFLHFKHSKTFGIFFTKAKVIQQFQSTGLYNKIEGSHVTFDIEIFKFRIGRFKSLW